MMNRPATIAHLCERYIKHYRATHHYSDSAATVASALKWLTETECSTPSESCLFGEPAVIGSLHIGSIDSRMIKHVRAVMDTSGRLKRQTVNDNLKRIQAMIAWAIEEEHFNDKAADRAAGALLVKTLRRGQSYSTEQRTVHSASPRDLDVFIAMAGAKMATMIQVKRMTGMRLSNLCAMNLRRIYPGTSGGEFNWPKMASVQEIKAALSKADVWLYVPQRHKTMEHNIALIIGLGPQALGALKPWVANLTNEIVFEGTKHSKPSGKAITPDGFRCQLYKEQRRMGIEFRPHQLRHTAATALDRIDEAGIKKAQLLLGHASEAMTKRYIDPNVQKIIDLAREHG